jgi:CHAT domain-containing protein/tetratricopeptide (TPR) repeat protein
MMAQESERGYEGGPDYSKLCISGVSEVSNTSLERKSNVKSNLTNLAISELNGSSVGTLSASPPHVHGRSRGEKLEKEKLEKMCRHARQKTGSDGSTRDVYSGNTEDPTINGGTVSRTMSADYGPGVLQPITHESKGVSQELVMSTFKLKSVASNPLTSPPLTPQVTNHSRPRLQSTNSQLSRSYENAADQRVVKLAADCLHAQDYSRMLVVLINEEPTIVVLFGQALAYYKLRKLPEAADRLTKMDEVASEKLDDNSNRYLAHYYLGEIELAHTKYRKAAKHYHKASMSYSTDTVARRYRIVQPSRSTIFSKQGSALRHAQQIMEAVKAYQNALSVAETQKDKLAVHTSLGNLYQSLGENASALEHYENTIALAEELRDYVSLGWAYGNMGNARLGLYQKDKALQHLEKSLELTVQYEPSPQAIGRAYNNLGTAYQSLNELEKAQEYYDLALSQAIYGMDIGGQARVFGNYGNLLMLQKKYESAITHYSEALSITTDRSTRSTAHHNRGCAFYEKAETRQRRLLEASITDFRVTFGGPSMKREASSLPLVDSVKTDYTSGRTDLNEVVSYHEETFQTIKGSSQGLSLSISLFETNSRTFHRLQDCLYNLGDCISALEYAEQSRARTLGELLLQRKGGQLGMPLSSPLKAEQIGSIVQSVDTTVVFMSYTGARILTWVFTPQQGKVVTNWFQVTLEEDQFDGKSLDHFLRFTLNEKLIDDSVEMYSNCSYDDSPSLTKLYQIFGEPLLAILNKFSDDHSGGVRDVIFIPDSYINLTPIVALLNRASQKFLGDKFCFRIMPSLLTLGILSQLKQVVVSVPEESRSFCIIGNPTIPTFKYQGETWNLGRLPFATQEAEAVAHILKATPTLHEQATKMVVLSMISSAKVIHLATHGSASAGFLAFAGLGSSRTGSVSDEKLVLLYPEDVEKLSISPALVVLSSCDSGRGTMKAEGIQGLARAFIVAGAQAVLTTLWRVPDESAAVFMQFFYQYMMDGIKGSHALQKAILSIRSFQKYSRYIHWSGYQLTGREIQFQVARNGASERMRRKLGTTTVFPRLDEVKSLEKIFIKDPYLPTDVQVCVYL